MDWKVSSRLPQLPRERAGSDETELDADDLRASLVEERPVDHVASTGETDVGCGCLPRAITTKLTKSTKENPTGVGGDLDTR